MRSAAVGLMCLAGTSFQLSGCQFNDITTSVTLSGQELIVTLIRGAILTPIDQAITAAVNDFFASDDE
jgi:hypothetical protein